MRTAYDGLNHEFVVEKAFSPVYDKFNLKHEFIFPGAKRGPSILPEDLIF